MDLNHKILGEGEPIIILHGLFGMLDNWQTVAKELAKDYMVILIDLRNHGKSPHSELWNVQLMAEDVVNFMESNWIYNANIIGHSMGGKVAMEVALTNPSLVEKLVVVDIGPRAYLPGHELIFKGLQSVPISKIGSRNEAEEALAEAINDKGVRQFLLKNISRLKDGGYRWKMNLPVIINNYESILEESRIDEVYDGPSLFIGGQLSNYIRVEDEVLIKEVFPSAEIIMIPDAGHWVHADQKDELVKVIREFI